MKERSSIRIVVAGNIRIYREGIRLFLEQFDDIDVTGVISSAADLNDACQKTQADVVMVDARLPGVLNCLRNLKDGVPHVRVVILAAVMCRRQLATFLEEGDVAEFVTEDDSLEEMRFAIDSAIKNRFSCSPKLAHLLLDLPAESDFPADHSLSGELRLTRRQIRVLQLIDSGKSNKEIARSLNIETNTVKNHVHQILQRMQAQSRTEAAAKYRRMTAHPT